MNILGLNFGHDGAISILQNGLLTRCVSRERINRTKRSMTVDTEHIDLALSDVGLKVQDIDFIALTATQGYSFVYNNPDILQIKPMAHAGCIAASPMVQIISNSNSAIKFGRDMLGLIYEDEPHSRFYQELFPEHASRSLEASSSVGFPAEYISIPDWKAEKNLSEIANTNYSMWANDDVLSMGFHYPYTVCLHGVEIPAYAIAHHLSHAASCFYQSGFEEAAILTHDGGRSDRGANNGMIFKGRGNRIFPITPHHLRLGHLYEEIGVKLGFDRHGCAGKLMGLAPYGKPVFYNPDFVGNSFDLKSKGFEHHASDW